MAFDGIVIANLTYDMKKALEGGKVAKIAQPEKDELLLTPHLKLVAKGSLPVQEGKVVRVKDLRKLC